jgi:TolB-like protein
MDDRPESLGCYDFDGFRLDAARRVIRTRDGGQRLVVPPKAFDLAHYFVRHPGQVLSKGDLLAELWPGSVVEENGLTQIISILRSALGESRGENRYIVTVPRRGYCFVATVISVAAIAPPPTALDYTVAVLPLSNWSGVLGDGLLAAGIAEAILHRLASMAGIRLVAQTSSFAFRGMRIDAREVGRRLDARYLIEGGLQRAGKRLRITVQLIDATDGTHVWSLKFDMSAHDVFSVEDHVSLRVARALRHSLAGYIVPTRKKSAVGQSAVSEPRARPLHLSRRTPKNMLLGAGN